LAAYHEAVKLEKKGDYRRAKELYKSYVEFYPQNRMRPSFNETVRKITREKGLLLADLEKAAEGISPNGIPGKNIFLDYCHMNYRGYYLMSQEVLRVLAEREMIPGNGREPLPPPTMEEIMASSNWERHLYSF
jgi:hypothetical protein